MKPLHRSDRDATREQAAQWLILRQDGFSPEQAEAFARWCREHPDHALAVGRLEQTEALLEKLPFAADQLRRRDDAPPEAPLREVRPPGAHWWRLPLAAAAVLAVGVLGWWSRTAPTANGLLYSTSSGGYERVQLADGSLLELNADSVARVDFGAAERHVTLLAGEAHFSVAHERARPFVVSAGNVAVRAVGTAFNVRFAQITSSVEVLVTQGKVRVEKVSDPSAGPRGAAPETITEENNRARPEVEAGERILVPLTAEHDAGGTPRIEPVTIEAIEATLAWQARRIRFDEKPLQDVVALFNRRNRIQLVVADPLLARRPITGTFAADNVEAFVRLLEKSGDVVVERRSEGEVVLRRSP